MKQERDVLVVEDDETLNIVMCRLVRKAGFRFRGALDGHSAFEQARERPPRLIFIDVMLPGSSGFDLCKQLKSDPLTSHVPVVMVTALGDQENRHRGLQVGAVAYLVKPFNSEALVELINKYAE